jgi:hypothetical protein
MNYHIRFVDDIFYEQNQSATLHNHTMTKKECIKNLNQILEILPELDCFENICSELDIAEDELELVLLSKITNISNEDLD